MRTFKAGESSLLCYPGKIVEFIPAAATPSPRSPLTYGANLHTISKLLGHCNIRTTQIYAKIVDENKRKAVNLVPKI